MQQDLDRLYFYRVVNFDEADYIKQILLNVLLHQNYKNKLLVSETLIYV
jgi:hypothetical protein